MRRSLSDPGEKTYYFVFAQPGTTLQKMVKAIGAGFHIEEDFETSKDLGLDHYEVRSFTGWYRHITLVMLAHANFPGVCAQSIPLASPLLAVEALPTLDAAWLARPLLPLTVVFRASSAWAALLASSKQCEAGLGLVPAFDAGIAVVPAISIPNAVSKPASRLVVLCLLISVRWCSFPAISWENSPSSSQGILCVFLVPFERSSEHELVSFDRLL
jgi:hypothetical protein